MANLCVFCGSSTPKKPTITVAVDKLCTDLAQSGWDLVYGGGTHGLMGTVGKAFLAQGRNVTGIMPGALHDACGDQAELEGSRHLIVSDMFQRKQQMIRMSDAYLVLPGGVGTLDELSEVWSHRFFADFCPTLPYTIKSAPIVMPIISHGDQLTYEMLSMREEEGFIKSHVMKLLHVCKPDQVLDYLTERKPLAA